MAPDRAADSSGELAFAVEQLIGHELDGRYRIEALLGKGGMGAVLRARHAFTEQAVAVKVLRPTLARDPAAARRFVREARGTFQVDSEHAVRVTDFGSTADGLLYMVLELLDGHTVGAELARDGRMAPRRAVHVARQVAEALTAAHRVGLIHRDLKPDNVMLVRRGGDPDFVKVLDFGLVKVIEGAGEHALSMAALTQGDVVFGTPDYMAPEQALGQALDARADLYALGAMLFEMISGRPPFEAASAMEILVAQVRQAPPPLAAVVAGVDDELAALVARLLAKAREARPTDAAAVVAALAAIEARLGGAAGRVANARTVDLPSLAGMAIPASAPGSGSFDSGLAGARPPLRTNGTSDAGSESASATGMGLPFTGVGLPIVDLDDAAEAAELQRPRRMRVLLVMTVVAAILLAVVVIRQRSVRRHSGPVVLVDGGAPAPALPPADARATTPAPIDAGPSPAPRDAGPRPRLPETAELDRHLTAAEQARRAGNALRQLAEADLALEVDPRSARARYLMGDALVSTGDVTNGCRYLRGARRIPAAAARATAAGCPADPD